MDTLDFSMARIRTIKPEFWTSEQIVECSPTTRLLFIGMWSFSDDGGVHPASVKRLKMEVFPGDAITDSQVAVMVYELLKGGLVRTFKAKENLYWSVTGWHHQKIDKPTYKHPQPCDKTEWVSEIDDTSTSARLAVGESSPPDIDVDVDVSLADGRPKKIAGAKRKFEKPAVEEVAAYCTERKNGIDPQHFLDHYESNGWKVGRNQMKDWKSAVRTWEKNGLHKTAEPKKSQLPTDEDFVRINEVGLEAWHREQGN